MEAMDIQAVESKLSDVTVTAIPMINKQTSNQHQQQQQQQHHRHHHNNHHHQQQQQQHQQQMQHHHNNNNNNNNNHNHHRNHHHHHHQQQQQQHQQNQQQSMLSPNAIPSHISLKKTTVLGPLTITPTSSLPSPMASFSVQSPLSLITTSQHSPPPITVTTRVSSDITTPLTSAVSNIQSSSVISLTKYAQLLSVIEEMGRDIRPTYSGSRSSAERLKRGIVHARILVRECLMETERSAKQ